VEELESFIEQFMAVPVLMRILAHFFHNDYFGAAMPERHFESTYSIAQIHATTSKIKNTYC